MSDSPVLPSLFVVAVYIVATKLFESDIDRDDVARWMPANVAVISDEKTGESQLIVQTDGWGRSRTVRR